MQCPNCGWEQSGRSAECTRCQIVFAAWKGQAAGEDRPPADLLALAAQAQAEAKARGLPAARPEDKPAGCLETAAGLGVLLGILLMIGGCALNFVAPMKGAAKALGGLGLAFVVPSLLYLFAKGFLEGFSGKG